MANEREKFVALSRAVQRVKMYQSETKATEPIEIDVSKISDKFKHQRSKGGSRLNKLDNVVYGIPS